MATLVARYIDQVTEIAEQHWSKITDRESFGVCFREMLWELYELTSNEPVLCEIWVGAEADKAVHEYNLRDSMENAHQLQDLVAKHGILAKGADTEATCLLICHVVGDVMRLAITLRPELGRMVFEQFVGMIMTRFGFENT